MWWYDTCRVVVRWNNIGIALRSSMVPFVAKSNSKDTNTIGLEIWEISQVSADRAPNQILQFKWGSWHLPCYVSKAVHFRDWNGNGLPWVMRIIGSEMKESAELIFAARVTNELPRQRILSLFSGETHFMSIALRVALAYFGWAWLQQRNGEKEIHTSKGTPQNGPWCRIWDMSWPNMTNQSFCLEVLYVFKKICILHSTNVTTLTGLTTLYGLHVVLTLDPQLQSLSDHRQLDVSWWLHIHIGSALLP